MLTPIPELVEPTLSEKFVKAAYPAATVEQHNVLWYVIDKESGKALSPLCTGEGPAWRFAEIHIKHFGKLSI